ncbi:MAG: N-6 DNA methylase [Atopobiaceae bacterium]|nr:N-6 DNA methylase [Atopobiaceae bacterium]
MSAVNRLSRLELAERLDFIAFMEYCSYVSGNAQSLGLDDFDPRYSIADVRRNLGNEYLASDFVEYYAGLCSKNPALPDLREMSLHVHDLSGAISDWAASRWQAVSGPSPSSYEEDADRMVALSTWFNLAGFFSSDIFGKQASDLYSSTSMANTVVRLADVEGKSVLDFACGNGIFLSTALANGAASICGRDINAQAVMRAKILCFFANAGASRDVAVGNLLACSSTTMSAQRVLVAPWFGARIRELDIQEEDYYADVLGQLVGEGSVGALDMEDFCVAKAFASLAEDGIAVLHVSASFLFHQQKARRELRRALVQKGYLRTVIELPGGCVPGTRVKSALLIIGKQPTEDGVLIVDLDSKKLADKGYVSKGRGSCEITETGIDWLAKTVEQRDEIALVSTVADREQILESGSNLCYSTYGDVFDYATILEETRSTEDIMSDICAAQASADSLGEQIADILNSIEKKG